MARPLTVNAAQASVEITRTYNLKPGWNSIFLEIEPKESDPANLLAVLPEGSALWTWMDRQSPVEFIRNPDEKNGVLVHRRNLTVLANSALADKPVTGPAESQFVEFTVPATLIKTGINSIAAEVHQATKKVMKTSVLILQRQPVSRMT